MILWIDEAVCCLLGIVYLGICIDRAVSSSAKYHQTAMALRLIEQLERLLDALAQEKIEYALCGGIAVNIHGHVRTTQDIDVLVQEKDLSRVMPLLQRLNFTFTSGRVPFQAGTAEERKLYRATQIESKDVLTVDVLIVTPILEDVWESRQVFAWLDRAVTVVSLEGLTKMKLMAGRHQDLADLENLGIEFGDEDQ